MADTNKMDSIFKTTYDSLFHTFNCKLDSSGDTAFILERELKLLMKNTVEECRHKILDIISEQNRSIEL